MQGKPISFDQPLPVEEMLAYEEFTDRVEILRELTAWVKNIQQMTAPSTAIISPRCMGKTVLLNRLVNTVTGGPLGGRFGFNYLKPLSIKGAIINVWTN